MKRLLKIILGLLFVYVLFWCSVAAYFTYADRYKNELEAKLSEAFDRPVSIADIKTVWRGVAPRVQLRDFQVEGDNEGQPALAFESLSATVSPLSVLRLWPSFTEFEVTKPVLEIVTLDGSDVEIAGLKLKGQRRSKEFTQRVLSWLLDQRAATWKGGEIIWRRDVDDIQHFKNISISYKRDEQYRKLQTEITTPKGVLAFIATSNGDLINQSNWDASLEVLGEEGARLLEPNDFSVRVNEGKGRVLLKTLDIARIRDFVKLSGLVSNTGWLLDAKLAGRLHDVHFDFSGPLLAIESWGLEASASDIGFRAVGRAPAMNNLRGELKASIDGGRFVFATRDSEFKWARWYQRSFPINRAMGEFSWTIGDDGGVAVNLRNGEFEDINAKLSNINAEVKLNPSARKVSSFGQLFKVESVADLRFEDGELLESPVLDRSQAPIIVDAYAEFEVSDISKLIEYLPNIQRLDKFSRWSKAAFRSGSVKNGVVTYKGEATADAIASGTATLDATAQFDNVIVDYAPKFNWPAAEKGQGVATVRNDLLTISPDQIWLNGDPVTDALLTISSLFDKKRLLTVKGNTTTSLIKGMDFIFKGPLIKPSEQLDELPILPKEGSVDITTEVEIPLSNVAQGRVNGTAVIRDGLGVLPGDVALSDIEATVKFTERSVTSDNIRAKFLGGETSGKLETLKQAQPPVLKLSASGEAHTLNLTPWVGEHLLTWFDGKAPWQGSVLIDGGNVDINGSSNLVGIEVSAPAPLAKPVDDAADFALSMTLGGKTTPPSLRVSYRDMMQASFKANARPAGSSSVPSLLDNALISIGSESAAPLKSGINFLIEEDAVDLDKWLSAIIDLASYQPKVATDNTDFLDAMRSINISAKDPLLFGRRIGPLNVTAMSVDGRYWIGTLDGENVDGTMQLQPRDELAHYGFKLAYLNLVEELENDEPLAPVDYSLVPAEFPSVAVSIDRFRLAGKNLGSLSFSAKPSEDAWQIEMFDLVHNGIKTTATGGWRNNTQDGSVSEFEFSTVIDEAEGALIDMDFDGLIRKGMGNVDGKLSWVGAPHEFEYARLNGEFEAFIKDGELVKVEPGGGKLLGLLNFNAIARRLVFDFRDVFASGLIFDRMRYSAILAEGEVILRDAFILAPAVFVRMEGKVDLDKELIDMEVHVSPELGGNLALLSALANPTAGAVVFLTQRIFKDEMRKSSFKSYRALGTWENFEMVEMKAGDELGATLSADAQTDEVAAELGSDLELQQASEKGDVPDSILQSDATELEASEQHAAPKPEKPMPDLEKLEASPIP